MLFHFSNYSINKNPCKCSLIRKYKACKPSDTMLKIIFARTLLNVASMWYIQPSLLKFSLLIVFPLLLVHWYSFQNCTLKWLPTSFNCSSISLFFSAFASWVSPQILKPVLWSLFTTTKLVCCSLTHHIPLTFQVQLPDWCASDCHRPVLLSPVPRAPRLWCFIIDFSTVFSNQPFFWVSKSA